MRNLWKHCWPTALTIFQVEVIGTSKYQAEEWDAKKYEHIVFIDNKKFHSLVDLTVFRGVFMILSNIYDSVFKSSMIDVWKFLNTLLMWLQKQLPGDVL